MAGAQVDGRVARGDQSRQLVLARAVQLASIEGLEGLSLGRLAGDLKLSKSGVFALFGSKEDLQLATVRAAIRIFLTHVVHPAHETPPGLGRLWQLCARWLVYSEERVFPGGCFFYSAAAEYDARPGRVRDAIAETRKNWSSLLEQTLREAQQAGQARPDIDIPQLVFEIASLMEMANGESVLHNDSAYYRMATRGILNRLRDVATDPALVPPAV